MKQTWNTIRQIVGRGTSVATPDSLCIANTITSDPAVVSDGFMNYFDSIGLQAAPSCGSNLDRSFEQYLSDIPPQSEPFLTGKVTAEEVMAAVQSLNCTTSSDHYHLQAKIVFSHVSLILKPLLHLINSIFKYGHFPDCLKIARVVPIPKTGDLSFLKNYRPISLLPIFSKIIEKIIYNRLYYYLTSNNYIYDHQYGFRQGHSTALALLQMQSFVLHSLDNNQFSCGIFLDIAKAFDTVNHSLLLKKLNHYGIDGITFDLFQSYLLNRSSYVVFNNHCSSVSTSNIGVPQGSILGPLLFILFINDLHKASSFFKTIIYADDTNLFASHDNITVLMNTINTELSNIFSWFQCNRLSLNFTKTHYILFRTKNKYFPSIIPPLTLGSIVIQRVFSTKFLGVFIDDQLHWSLHINHIVKLVSRNVGILGKVRGYINKSSALLLYHSFVQPYLSYCSVVWSSTYVSHFKSLISIQNRAIRIISYLPYRSDCKNEYKVLNILPFPKLFDFHRCLFIYCHQTHKLPPHNTMPGKRSPPESPPESSRRERKAEADPRGQVLLGHHLLVDENKPTTRVINTTR